MNICVLTKIYLFYLVKMFTFSSPCFSDKICNNRNKYTYKYFFNKKKLVGMNIYNISTLKRF